MDKPPAPLRWIRVFLTALLIKAYVAVHPARTRFRGLLVETPPGCLPPRYTVSTGLLAEALESLGLEGARVLDLGCGSGALTLVAARRGAYVVGVDVVERCVRAARRNLVSNGLYGGADVVVCEGAGCLRGGFDVAVSNPPFLPVRGGPAYACGEGCRVARRMLLGAASRARLLLYAWSSLSGRPPLPCRRVGARRGLLDMVYVCLYDGLPGAGVEGLGGAELEHVSEDCGGLPPGE